MGLIIALAWVLAVATYSGPVGTTSEWGIVVAPCAWCGATNDIEVHHIYPQHLWPERARDTNNMVCLCRRCHFVLGHRGCWTNAVTNLVRMIELK
jgi:hypothetical protein